MGYASQLAELARRTPMYLRSLDTPVFDEAAWGAASFPLSLRAAASRAGRPASRLLVVSADSAAATALLRQALLAWACGVAGGVGEATPFAESPLAALPAGCGAAYLSCPEVSPARSLRLLARELRAEEDPAAPEDAARALARAGLVLIEARDEQAPVAALANDGPVGAGEHAASEPARVSALAGPAGEAIAALLASAREPGSVPYVVVLTRRAAERSALDAARALCVRMGVALGEPLLVRLGDVAYVEQLRAFSRAWCAWFGLGGAARAAELAERVQAVARELGYGPFLPEPAPRAARTAVPVANEALVALLREARDRTAAPQDASAGEAGTARPPALDLLCLLLGLASTNRSVKSTMDLVRSVLGHLSRDEVGLTHALAQLVVEALLAHERSWGDPVNGLEAIELPAQDVRAALRVSQGSGFRTNMADAAALPALFMAADPASESYRVRLDGLACSLVAWHLTALAATSADGMAASLADTLARLAASAGPEPFDALLEQVILHGLSSADGAWQLAGMVEELYERLEAEADVPGTDTLRASTLHRAMLMTVAAGLRHGLGLDSSDDVPASWRDLFLGKAVGTGQARCAQLARRGDRVPAAAFERLRAAAFRDWERACAEETNDPSEQERIALLLAKVAWIDLLTLDTGAAGVRELQAVVSERLAADADGRAYAFGLFDNLSWALSAPAVLPLDAAAARAARDAVAPSVAAAALASLAADPWDWRLLAAGRAMEQLVLDVRAAASAEGCQAVAERCASTVCDAWAPESERREALRLLGVLSLVDGVRVPPVDTERVAELADGDRSALDAWVILADGSPEHDRIADELFERIDWTGSGNLMQRIALEHGGRLNILQDEDEEA